MLRLMINTSYGRRLPPTAFWLGCPRPVIYQKDTGTWKSRGVWDVRFMEEIGGKEHIIGLKLFHSENGELSHNYIQVLQYNSVWKSPPS